MFHLIPQLNFQRFTPFIEKNLAKSSRRTYYDPQKAELDLQIATISGLTSVAFCASTFYMVFSINLNSKRSVQKLEMISEQLNEQNKLIKEIVKELKEIKK